MTSYKSVYLSVFLKIPSSIFLILDIEIYVGFFKESFEEFPELYKLTQTWA